MKLMRAIIALLVVIGLMVPAMPVLASGSDGGQEYAPDRILVAFKAEVTDAGRNAVQQRHGDNDYRDVPGVGVRVVKVPPGKVQERLAAYRGERDVQFAEPDYVARAIETPIDPGFGSQWGLTRIQASQAWDVTTSNSGVTIAILDTGIDASHEDLAAKVVAVQNFTTSGTADDNYGHGTHVAGIAAASTNNTVGVAGAGYSASLMNGKVLDDTGSGYYSWIISGIKWAADNGAEVINMSLGGSGGSTALKAAIDYAWGKGVVVVAAAGNSGSSAPSYPAYYSNCIAVAATDTNDVKASWSNYGSSWVDVAAPGVGIYSTLPDHANQMGGTNYGSLSGTSMATPFVAGQAALIWATSYGTSATSVRNRIESTADPVTGTGTNWKYGRINEFKSVTAATPDFSLSTAPSSQTVVQGVSATYNVTITPVGGFTASVVLSVSGLPTGAEGAFAPESTTTSSTLTVSTLSSTPTGTYTLTLAGQSGTLKRTATATLVVSPSGTFSLTPTPTSQTVSRGSSTTYTVAIVPAGFTGPVTLTVSGLPSRATASFSPNPTTGSSSQLTVTTSTRSPTGTYTLTIKGTSGGLTAQTKVTLVLRR
jgi:thermitase